MDRWIDDKDDVVNEDEDEDDDSTIEEQIKSNIRTPPQPQQE